MYDYLNNPYTNPYRNVMGQQPTIPQMPQMPVQQQPTSNILRVTSLSEALNRAQPNSDLIFLDQDNPVVYRVATDTQGNKTYKVFDITERQATKTATTGEVDMSKYVTVEDYNALKNEFTALKDEVAKWKETESK